MNKSIVIEGRLGFEDDSGNIWESEELDEMEPWEIQEGWIRFAKV